VAISNSEEVGRDAEGCNALDELVLDRQEGAAGEAEVFKGISQQVEGEGLLVAVEGIFNDFRLGLEQGQVELGCGLLLILLLLVLGEVLQPLDTLGVCSRLEQVKSSL